MGGVAFAQARDHRGGTMHDAEVAAIWRGWVGKLGAALCCSASTTWVLGGVVA